LLIVIFTQTGLKKRKDKRHILNKGGDELLFDFLIKLKREVDQRALVLYASRRSMEWLRTLEKNYQKCCYLYSELSKGITKDMLLNDCPQFESQGLVKECI
jgi:hypothetical protein